MRVLIVEDEVRLAETLRDLLELERYTADICHDGESGLDNALSDIYDLVILDVMLPKKDGFSVLRALRQAGKTVPVLMLSARSELADRVEGLDCGADYYLTKPFEPKELLACVRMLTRRQPEQRASQNLEYGDLRLETDTFQLSCGERSVRLSRKAVLAMLAADSRILKDPEPVVWVAALADSSVNLTIRAWVKNSDYWNVFFEHNEEFYKELPKHGLSFPFPQMDVHVKKE